ncbi:LPXTG cell wall anchor domain-containing protein [Streptomyces cavernae]|uniref:LPXTG cell wall anchor domain-containing protein n=1 Tax=Streptomyces cavernae TaxID=2259034 RepID=UPI001391C095|nr:LPXTG cell wall anchor domain-containing protein [Streptomyces cavernae]
MSAAHRTSSAARRSLLTATAAGTLLGALWFVPSANATMEGPAGHTMADTTPATASVRARTTTEGTAETADTANTADTTDTADSADSADVTTTSDASGTEDGRELADTGAFDTTPYVIGGILFLGLGAGFVTYSVRRERTDAY